MARSASVSDLTNAEWAVREPLMPAAKPGGRPPRHVRREVVQAIGSVWRGGIAWRSLPHELPPSAISHPRKRPNKGDTGLRWGQDAERPQAPSAGRHRRPGVAGGRASGGCRGPRWHPGRVGRPPPDRPGAAPGLGRHGLPGPPGDVARRDLGGDARSRPTATSVGPGAGRSGPADAITAARPAAPRGGGPQLRLAGPLSPLGHG
jgi:transposase